jgi:hypothetical protein
VNKTDCDCVSETEPDIEVVDVNCREIVIEVVDDPDFGTVSVALVVAVDVIDMEGVEEKVLGNVLVREQVFVVDIDCVFVCETTCEKVIVIDWVDDADVVKLCVLLA